ncbi:hypothetical protein [Nonomuraea lactucae]|uniref:hypothetical protein n=1 Tax=Nonomuraea lactucae TaxID=2249762 RepID=UPI000DE54763|nr:hypothetical protein [Nonomuraea lactucae]
MTQLRRTTFTRVTQPIVGAVIKYPSGPVVPIEFHGAGTSEDLALLLSDPVEARGLANASAIAASVLEAEHGMPAPERAECGGNPVECAHETARGQLEEERDVYRAILTRLTTAERPSELWPAIRDASVALQQWAGQP